MSRRHRVAERARLRKRVFARDRYSCRYCGKPLGRNHSELTIDHIMPRARGGTDDESNLITCCEPCNLRKGCRTLKEAGMHIYGRKPDRAG